MRGREIVNGADRGIDPGVRILLGPERRGMRQRELARGRRDNRADLVREHGFHTGRADVHSQIHAFLPANSDCGVRTASPCPQGLVSRTALPVAATDESRLA
jgi:hypothetical protein